MASPPLSTRPQSVLQRMRLLVFPRGSVRERVAFLAKVSVLEARRGPRAWWSAVRSAGRLLWPRPASSPRVRPAVADSAAATRRGVHFVGEVPGLVSIVLPVYNQASLLRESIASVLAQTYADFELIVLSDGSTDGVERVFDQFAGDPRVRFLVQPNQKLPHALSNGFDLARGEFFTWTSADNLMEPGQLQRLVEFLRAHAGIELVFADYYAIDDRGELLADRGFRPHNRQPPTSPAIRLPRHVEGFHDGGDNYIGPCFLYRGRAGKVVGDYAPELGVEDYDYWLRLLALMPAAHLGTDELLYRYRVHDNSLGAQAKELGIMARRDRLLEVDRQRRRDLTRPWPVEVDARLAAWLQPEPHARGDAAADHRAGGHRVALVPADALAARTPSPATHTVAWFAADDAEAPYRWRLAIAGAADACLTDDATTADRLALFTTQAFVVPPPAAVAFARLHAQSAHLRQFAARTRPGAQQDRAASRTPARVRLAGDRALRVLLQVDDFAHGGVEQVVLDLARTLSEGGARVELLVLGTAGDAAVRALSLGLRLHRLQPSRRREDYVALLRAGVDVINAHFSTFGADLAAAEGVCFVQTVHNSYVWLDAAQIAAIAGSVAATAAFACVSAAAARYADVVLGVPPAKLIVLGNGIDVDRIPAPTPAARAAARQAFGVQAHDFVFLQVASLYPPKGQRVALHALQALQREHPHARIVFAGAAIDADYPALLAQEARSLGVDSSIRFLGQRDDVTQLLVGADAFLLPSYWEGFSLAIAEAAVAGLPLVLADVGAAREQVAVAGGELVPPPYASITAIRRETMGALVHKVQPEFAAALAAAMRLACQGRVARPDPARCRAAFDRRVAFGQHMRLFQWFAAGGKLASARPWLTHRPTRESSTR